MARRFPISSPLDSEHGTIFKQGAVSVSLGYPAPYRVGVSSLGFQLIYKRLNNVPGLACTRFFMPEQGMPSRVAALESDRPVSNMQGILFSVACEQELFNIVALLSGMGLSPLASERRESDPPVIIGGPLTMIDPLLPAPFADVVVSGTADHLIDFIGTFLVETRGEKRALLASLESRHTPPDLSKGKCIHLTQSPELIPDEPASAVTWSPEAEFRNLFLVEATRGCRRRCAFCTMSRSAAHALPFHPYPVAQVLEAIPEEAPGVGLVGAAVTDHPEIERIVALISEKGQRVSLSSIRADRLTLTLARLLRQGGGRTITLAADGASERVRKRVRKGILETHLIEAVERAREAGFQALKIYSMVGLPGEEDADIVEYAKLLVRLSRALKVSTTVQAFVPKPATPLAQYPMTDIRVIADRLALLKRQTKGRVRVLPTSPKWSWVDWRIAHAREKAALVAISAFKKGGKYAAWKHAIARHLDPC
jgi:radical SAM superfamily enzyme YgiQ (UPF0313 family)